MMNELELVHEVNESAHGLRRRFSVRSSDHGSAVEAAEIKDERERIG